MISFDLDGRPGVLLVLSCFRALNNSGDSFFSEFKSSMLSSLDDDDDDAPSGALPFEFTENIDVLFVCGFISGASKSSSEEISDEWN